MKALVFYIETGNGFKSPAVAIARELAAGGIDARPADLFKEAGVTALDKFLVESWRMLLSNELLFRFIFSLSDSFFYHVEMFWTTLYVRRRLAAYIEKERPDFVVCTHFIGTYVLERILPKLPRPVPVYGYNSEVILFHKSYKNKKTNGYFVSTTQGLNQMVAGGMDSAKTHLTGFPIDPKYRKAFGTMASERAALGLKDQFTVLLTFGGEGVGDWGLVRDLEKLRAPVQVVAVCGKNEALKAELEAWGRAHPDFALVVKGFTTNLQDYIYCCDLSAGKAGLNVVFESLFLKRPFLVLKAMANERHCAQWVVDQGYGWWPRSLAEAVAVVTSGAAGAEAFRRVKDHTAVPPCTFDLKEMISIVKTEVPAAVRTRLRAAEALCFDLAGTLCDIPIGDQWEAVNLTGIRQVLAIAGAPGTLGAEASEVLAQAFLAEKIRLRKEAKTSLREYEIRAQVREFFAAQAAANPAVAAWLKARALTEADWDEIEFQFIKPELDITLPFEGARQLLEALKPRYPLYLLSNNVSRVLVEKIVAKIGLDGLFTQIIVSSDVGYRKPHESFLRAVEKVTGKPAARCVMIGDRLTQDIEMANRFGMASIHIAIVDHEDNEGADHIQADTRVHSLEEIRTLLG